MGVEPDTIAAISTAAGEAGIAIVRLSGPRSLEIGDEVFCGGRQRPSDMAANSFCRGVVQTGSRQDADEVILLVYHAPHSYTREDVIELQGHGGRMAATRILRAVLEAGARPAESGEFTRRAFLNGRIDLLQAEAVCDLITAHTDRAATAAMEQLEGSLSACFAKSYNVLIAAASDLEATLDFAEDELPEATVSGLCERVKGVITDLENLLATWEEGHLLREGATVVIAGQPNVGKSTLLNRLLGTNRAIVSEMPGTTRDTIEEQMVLDGIAVRLVDTAGLREVDCRVEQEGVSRAQASLARADLVLYVIDGSESASEKDQDTVSQADPKRCLVILNKTDLGQEAAESDFAAAGCLAVSLLQDSTVTGIREAMTDRLKIQGETAPHAVISERHRAVIQAALDRLQNAESLLADEQEDQLVLAAADLRDALEKLGTITGRIYTEELLDNIFSRFCVGK